MLLQSLMFLVRDSSATDFDYGVEGGKQYLEHKFSSDSTFSAEYKSLCRNIQATFKNVECALFPDPGRKVVRMKPDQPPCTIGGLLAVY